MNLRPSRYAGKLNLRQRGVPEANNRWGHMSRGSKSEFNRLQGRERRRCGEADHDAVELQRINDTRAVLAKKIKEHTAAVNSTQDLLSRVEYDDLDTRTELIDTLRRTQTVLEKDTEEQRELELQYRRIQNKRSIEITRPRKRKMVADAVLVPEELTPATDLLTEMETTHNATELFDNTMKKEPQ
ncbi:hypothetical protein Y032_0111g256 [Ancylostoma ceylanicum]|nr:hypothetical protein Y032_0111g256 [Ancylostoma ceylanicum]